MNISLTYIVIFGIIFIAFLYWLAFKGVKAHKCSVLKKDNLAGEIGEAICDISTNSKGEVKINGEFWKAIALNDIAKGDEIIVIDSKKLILYIKKI